MTIDDRGRDLRLVREPASVAAARRATGEVLEAWGLDDAVPTAQLLVSEVVTNAVLHARQSEAVDLNIRLVDAAVRVEVRDDDPTLPAMRHHTVDAITGRGLRILDAAAMRWGVEVIPDDGKRVWFELDPAATAALEVLDIDDVGDR